MNPNEADLFDIAHWQFHNQRWQIGRCRERVHDKCNGDCQTCPGQVMSVPEIERFDPFAFFMPVGLAELWDGRDFPAAIRVDRQDYEQCAEMLGMAPVC